MPKPSTDGISARLLQCLDRSAGKTQAALARFCSVSTAAVAQWVKNGSISDENLRKAAKFLGVNEQWLKTGEGPKDADGGVRSIGEFDEIPEGYSVVPEYEYRFSAGGGANNGKSIPELQQEESKPKEKDWYVKKEGKPAIYRDSFFCSYHTTPSKCVRAKVQGDSMEPELHDGDTILFRKNPDYHPFNCHIVDGAIYAISIEGDDRVKRLSKIKGGIRVSSDNPRYGDEDFIGQECDDKLRIFGRVIEVSRTF